MARPITSTRDSLSMRSIQSLRSAEGMRSKSLKDIENMVNTDVKAVNSVDSLKTGASFRLNKVDQFLVDMDPTNVVIRAALKDDDVVSKHLQTKFAYKWHTSFYWKLFINLLIVLNAIQIGLDVEVAGKTADDAWKVCDYIFTFFFALEMIVAIVALRVQYFCNPWSYLDFTVANVAIIDTCLLPLVEGDGTDGNGGLSTFRVFRLLKLMRLAKMLKVVPELMMVVQGLFASIKAMFWVFTLLLLVLYTAGIVCKEIIGTRESGYPAFSEQVMEEKSVLLFNNFMYFGSISRSMTTLFSMVILAEWSDVLRPVSERQPAMVLFFIVIVFVCSFGVLNVMIGVVVEHTNIAMTAQRNEEKLALEENQMKLASTLADLVFTFDQNSDDRISRNEMENPGNAEELLAVLGSLGLPYGYSLGELFEMLDVDGNGVLSKLEFVQGIFRLIHCDQFQRDCLFRTALGQVKQIVRKSQEELRQSFEQQLQKTFTHFIGVMKQPHQAESCDPCNNNNEFNADKLESAAAADHVAGLLPELPTSEADIPKLACLRIVEAEQLSLSGLWDALVSPTTFCLEAGEVSISDVCGGSTVSPSDDDTTKCKEVKNASQQKGPRSLTGMLSDLANRKQVTWDALQKSLLPVCKSENRLTCDIQAAEDMLRTLSSSREVIGFMPVVNRRRPFVVI